MTRKTLSIFRARHISLQNSLKTIKFGGICFQIKVIYDLMFQDKKKKKNGARKRLDP